MAVVVASPALRPPGDPRALDGTLAASFSLVAAPALSSLLLLQAPPRWVLRRWGGWPLPTEGALTSAVPGHDATERALPVVDGAAAPFRKYV